MSETAHTSAETPAQGSEFWRGVRAGTPIFLGYLPIGMAFGIVARTAGFTVLQAVVCSAVALAGAGQFVGVSLISSGAGLGPILVTNTIINLRYLLFGATIAGHLRGEPTWRQALLAHTLTDETFAVNVVDLRSGRGTPSSMSGVGVIAWVAWVGATAVGALATSAIGDPGAWGIGYAMAAMFTALLVGQIEERSHLMTAALAAVLTLAFGAVLPGTWSLVAAPVCAATVASVMKR